MLKGHMKNECLGFITKYSQKFEVVDRKVWDAENKYGNATEALEMTHEQST